MISFPYTSIKKVEGQTVSYDRAIDSKVKRLYNMLRYTQGVAIDVGGGFQVLADSGMTVKVHCDGSWGHVYGDFCYENQEYRSVVLDPSDPTYDRIDRIMLRNDISSEKRSTDIFYVKGTPASSPEPPALTSTPEIHEKCIAQILVQRNATTITQSNITDTRLNAELCGVLTNAFGEIDASQFFAQLESLAKDLQDAIKDIAAGSGTMLQIVYDPRGYNQDVFAYPAHIYKATFMVDEWAGDGPYTQTVAIEKVNNGPDITEESTMVGPLFIDDSIQGESQEVLKSAAAIVDSGTKDFGNNTITCSCQEKPTADAEIFFAAMMKGGA